MLERTVKFSKLKSGKWTLRRTQRESKQYQDLLENIKQEGVLCPIIIDSKGRVVDGVERVSVCIDLGISYVRVKNV